MGFKVKTSAGADFEPAPAGTHNAVCTRLIDMGTQDGGMYGPKRQVMIGFEIDERDPATDNKRFMVFGYYTLTLGEKANLRKLLVGMRGKDYDNDEEVDVAAIVGKPATLNVVHKEKQGGGTRAIIDSAGRLMKGMEPLTPEGGTICVSLDADAFDEAEFEKLSDRMKERLQETPEWAALADPNAGKNPQPVGQAAVPESDLDDDIPGW